MQIHEIVFHGKGGFDWGTVYNMPVWLRNFTFNKIKLFYDEQKRAEEEAMDKAKGIQKLNNSPSAIQQPNIPKATYSTKASKK